MGERPAQRPLALRREVEVGVVQPDQRGQQIAARHLGAGEDALGRRLAEAGLDQPRLDGKLVLLLVVGEAQEHEADVHRAAAPGGLAAHTLGWDALQLGEDGAAVGAILGEQVSNLGHGAS